MHLFQDVYYSQHHEIPLLLRYILPHLQQFRVSKVWLRFRYKADEIATYYRRQLEEHGALIFASAFDIR